MRAAVLRGFREDLAIEDVPEPEPAEDGVVLRVLACGVCRSDWHGWVGADPDVRPGAIGGHEFCGEVVAAGPRAVHAVGEVLVAPFILACGHCPACRAGHANTCPDQRLPGFIAPGAFAEYVAVPHDHNLAPLPAGLAPAVAAALGCRVTTAWHALTDRAALAPGEWLAIHGMGGVGLACLILGRAMGARVIAVDVVPAKLEHALGLGAEAAVDAGEGDVAARILAITGDGAHVSVEALGSAATTAASLACLRPLGRHVQIGMPAGAETRMVIDMSLVYGRNLALFGTRGMPAWKFPRLLGLIEAGRVDVTPILRREIALSDVSAALRAMDGPTPPGVDVVTDFAG